MRPVVAGQTAPRTVDDYLRQLRAALEGAPPALIQDALGDAEDYLREEVALDAYKPESEVVARVTRAFGRPEDVAAEYRAVEQRFERRRNIGEAKPRRGFFSVALDPRAYGGLLYALVALPVGILYFTWVVAGLSLSAGLAILIIGVPFTILFIASVRIIALMEGRIVELLLGKRMPRRLPSDETVQGLWPRIGAMLRDRRTWSTMFYMVLQLPLGIAYFVISVVGLALSLSLVAGPFVEVFSGRNIIQFGNTGLDRFSQTPLGMAAMIVIGFLLFFVVLHLVRGLTLLHARYAEATLVKT
ncbi:MAG: sensor domain-containing protein [Micropepsaceae bacterium]